MLGAGPSGPPGPTGAAGAGTAAGAGGLVAWAELVFLSLNEFWLWGGMGVGGAGVCGGASVSMAAAPAAAPFFFVA